MIKFKADVGGGRTLVGIGLSDGNFRKFREDPDSYIQFSLESVGVDVALDIMIFNCRDEVEFTRKLKQDGFLTQATITKDSPQQ